MGGMLIASLLFSICSIITRKTKDFHCSIISLFHGSVGVVSALSLMFLLWVFADRKVTLVALPFGIFMKLCAGGSFDTLTSF